MFTVYSVSETAQVELKCGRVYAPAADGSQLAFAIEPLEPGAYTRPLFSST